MTTDISGLAFTLRSMRNQTCDAAADALEAMVGEVGRLTTNGIHSCWEECPRLPCVQGREIRALTAERDRLKAALSDVMEWITNWEPPFTQDGEWAATELKARKALGGDAS